MTAALRASVRHGAFPAITAVSTPPSITWMADWGMSATWIAVALAGVAALYAVGSRGVIAPEEGDTLSQLLPSKAAYFVSAALLLGFAAFTGWQGA
ncbi:MAG: hypothetical protein ACJAVS_002682 [Paracoccaceae bacterium]|jgi:hypothetical protein